VSGFCGAVPSLDRVGVEAALLDQALEVLPADEARIDVDVQWGH
jgi:hypothetical protein